MKRLADIYPNALVTGGTSGLGLAFCEMLCAEGVEVTSLARRPDRLESKHDFECLALDLSDREALQQYLSERHSDLRSPDLLINNAGYGAFFEWDKFPEEEIARQFEVLFMAPVLFCRAFAPEMKRRGGGGIVNVTSLAGLFPLPYMPTYNAGKAGLSAFSASLSLEYNGTPFVSDFRLGDFRSNFNKAASRDGEIPHDSSRGRAWSQIEKQLDASPEVVVAADALRRILLRRKDGVSYAGNFMQARLAPLFHRLVPDRLLRSFLRRWYCL